MVEYYYILWQNFLYQIIAIYTITFIIHFSSIYYIDLQVSKISSEPVLEMGLMSGSDDGNIFLLSLRNEIRANYHRASEVKLLVSQSCHRLLHSRSGVVPRWNNK